MSAAGRFTARSEIEDLTTSGFADAAARWRTAAAESDEVFAQHRLNIASPGGTTWEGDAKDAALDRATADGVVAGDQNDVVRESADIAENGGHDINAAQREALEAITAAEEDGFRVGADLSVTDMRKIDLNTMAARYTAAKEHAEDIRWYAERLGQTVEFVEGRLQAKAAELEGIRFEGEGDGLDSERMVQLVNNETQGDDGDTESDAEDDGGYKPHPEYPDHKPNGEWGPKNSGAEGGRRGSESLRQAGGADGHPIERQKVWVYLTDPETGQKLRREYDGLEPIPGHPGKYNGLEHKLGNKAPTDHQQHFDDLVRSGIPATGTLNGQPIEVVDAELVRTPRPGDATAEAAAGTSSAGSGAGVPDSIVDSTGGSGGTHAEGTVPVPPHPRTLPISRGGAHSSRLSR